jgi:hypothetical protein
MIKELLCLSILDIDYTTQQIEIFWRPRERE